MVKKIKKLLKNSKGFTLVELLAVIVILGIIAAIAVPSVGSIIDNSKKDAHIANALMLADAAKLASIENTTGKTTYTMNELVTAGYLESVPKSPGDSGDYSADDCTVEVSTSGNVKTYTINLVGADSHYYIGGSADGDGSTTTELQGDGARDLVTL